MNIYPYGSQIYGTADEHSDHDFIVVGDMEEQIITPRVTFNCFTYQQWQDKLRNHEPKPLECYFLPKHYKLSETYEFNWKLNLVKLRHSFSRQASISWVKCKKKIADNEVHTGIKSMFHSLRILNFGIQIASIGKIYDYQQANRYWDNINAIYLSTIEKDKLWDCLKHRYQSEYNRLATEFKKLAPKE